MTAWVGITHSGCGRIGLWWKRAALPARTTDELPMRSENAQQPDGTPVEPGTLIRCMACGGGWGGRGDFDTAIETVANVEAARPAVGEAI